VGAPHQRARLFILGWLADSDRCGLELIQSCELLDRVGAPQRNDADGRGAKVAHTTRTKLSRRGGKGFFRMPCESRPWPPKTHEQEGWTEYVAKGGPQPAVCRGTDGDSIWVDRLRLLGNGVVPLVAAHAVRTLTARAVSG
jgi:hypothetical protein